MSPLFRACSRSATDAGRSASSAYRCRRGWIALPFAFGLYVLHRERVRGRRG